MLPMFLNLSMFDLILEALCLCTTYIAVRALYNLFFHPLAGFPGPKLTASSKLYEFYYDVLRGGQFFYEIQRMHELYGPIVRINPDELHINDATYYGTLYAGGGQIRDKYQWFTNAAGSPTSTFATVGHDLHRTRRSALNPFFSKASVVKLEPLIHEKVEGICAGMDAQFQQEALFDFGAAYMSFALDTVSHYAFGAAECWNCLLEPGFSADWKEAIVSSFENATLIRYIPWLLMPLKMIPYQWITRVHRAMGMYFKSYTLIKGHVLSFLDAEHVKVAHHDVTIFSELRNGKLPAIEQEPRRLIDEANILMIAGGEAITQLLTIVSYHLLDNPHILVRLREELDNVMPRPDSPITWCELEKLPYLTAVIQEGLRISAIVTTRLPRVAPHEVLKYQSFEIPPGTPVSMTSHFIHLDPVLWPEPLKFLPGRWMDDGTDTPRGNREYLVPFSKGSRGCVGINLAHAQAYLAIARVFRRFDFELFQTDRRDVTIVRDCFNGQPYKGSKGVRAHVVGLRA
ncbi:hypothetical protein AUEXF2481DRAFT_3847 [Aureobasidium subglaciale EXF-2481]|uniref:Cytochrome P450 n=1 Tax=Aureobasidium subglaciale (strain EXF-2481) TaxID=1043005 RepID=A0A074YQG2_AURSE|nr:uncharacterized protein AUEXF2481DRAFT_3847 [Aureobasidium subglaciale EXF-2481]KEQ96327.1 hypothetical protein AUEXF2481DRAFT_3847 [Aureobasidium subglaciale EXF-2481]